MTIVAKLDFTKIDQSKLFPGKNGAKYLDVVLVETPNNQYGNTHMVVQGVTKEERQAGVKGAILGNAKTLGGQQAPVPQRKPRPTDKQLANQTEVNDEDIPF